MSLESTKADDIAVLIEEAIVSGELEPGSVLRQEQLSERFGVSRTPVREALRRLAALGLVSFEPNRGVRVRTMSHGDLREAFIVRAELEGLVTELAARRLTPEGLHELEECERRFARLTKELRSRDPGGDRRALMTDWMRANHAFHDVLYRIADAPYIESVAKAARRTFSGPRALGARRRGARPALRAQPGRAPRDPPGARRRLDRRRPRARARARDALVRAPADDPRARRRRLGSRLSFTTRPELRGTFGAVASTHWLASTAGMGVLERGGNAFDAACAAGFVLQVVEPHLNGPGGDLPAVIWPAERGEPLVLCAQGVSPQAATIERFRSLGHDLVPGTGLLAACVPGSFGGWLLLLRAVRDVAARGRARLRDRLRRRRVPGRARRSTATIRNVEPLLRGWPGSAELYLPPPAAGQTFRNRALAATWRRLLDEARGGSREDEIERARRVYYEGFVAEEIDRFSREDGGLLTGDDLGRVARDARAAGDRRLPRADGLQDGGWGQGPAGLQQLALLEGIDVASLGEAELVHVVTEAAKLAFADRDASYGDADVPLDRLLSRGVRRRAAAADRRRGERRAAARARAAAGARLGRRRAARRRRADARRHRPPRRRRPLREHGLGDAERRLAAELADDPGARLAARHARADVLARGGTAVVARAGQAAAHDALAGARAA